MKNRWFRRGGEDRGWELADPKGLLLYRPDPTRSVADSGFGVSVGVTNFS